MIKTGVRMDRMSFGKAQRLPNGYLRVPITATRAGIFVYRLDDGSEWREYRPAEEVFDQESMESLKGVPATNGHPPEEINGGLLDSTNTKDHAVGYTGETVSRADDLLCGWMTITDAETIAEVESGKKTEVSAGYGVQVETKSGLWRGQRYDAIQRKIRYNHVAIVKNARGGSEVKIHLDSADKRQMRLDSILDPEEPKGVIRMEKILTIGGVDYKVSAEAYAAITNRFTMDSQAIQLSTDKLKTLEDEKTKVVARADALDADVVKLKAQVDKAAAPEGSVRLDSDEFRSAVAKRVSLEVFASKRLDSDLSKMSDKDIIVALIKQDTPDFKAEGKKAEDTYLQARLDHMIEAADDGDDEDDDEEEEARADADDEDDDEEEEEDEGASKRVSKRDSSYSRGKKAISKGTRSDAKNSKKEEKTPDEQRRETMEANTNRWQKPIGMTRNKA